MNHESILNTLLANTCASSEDYGGAKVFVYDLCCKKAVVIARLVGWEPFKYEITGFRIINHNESPYDLEEVKQLMVS